MRIHSEGFVRKWEGADAQHPSLAAAGVQGRQGARAGAGGGREDLRLHRALHGARTRQRARSWRRRRCRCWKATRRRRWRRGCWRRSTGSIPPRCGWWRKARSGSKTAARSSLSGFLVFLDCILWSPGRPQYSGCGGPWREAGGGGPIERTDHGARAAAARAGAGGVRGAARHDGPGCDAAAVRQSSRPGRADGEHQARRRAGANGCCTISPPTSAIRGTRRTTWCAARGRAARPSSARRRSMPSPTCCYPRRIAPPPAGAIRSGWRRSRRRARPTCPTKRSTATIRPGRATSSRRAGTCRRTMPTSSGPGRSARAPACASPISTPATPRRKPRRRGSSCPQQGWNVTDDTADLTDRKHDAPWDMPGHGTATLALLAGGKVDLLAANGGRGLFRRSGRRARGIGGAGADRLFRHPSLHRQRRPGAQLCAGAAYGRAVQRGVAEPWRPCRRTAGPTRSTRSTRPAS